MRSAMQAASSIQIQERDLAVLRGLFESRVMTNAHISAIFFDGRSEAAKKRLQKLKSARLIGERRRSVRDPSILSLAKDGLLLLLDRGILAEYPSFDMPILEKRAHVSDMTLRHELEVMDVKAAFYSALRETQTHTIAEFGTWPRLYEFTATHPQKGTVLTKPDGFIRIQKREDHGGFSERMFFLEVDRSTEVLETLVSRAACYLDYFKSGGFAVRNGDDRTTFKEYPFRVLMVFKTAERRNNATQRLLQNIPPILTQVCLSTIEEVRENPLGAIWIRPIEYREAISAPFNPEQRRYKRQTAREMIIEAAFIKKSLINWPHLDVR